MKKLFCGLFKESNGNRTGPNMGSDNASDACSAKIFDISFPKKTAVFNIFLKHVRVVAGVAKQDGHFEINSAGFFNFLYKKVVSLF